MKKTYQGTYNYAFSNMGVTSLNRLGYPSETGPIQDLYQSYTFWVSFNKEPFCIQIRELNVEKDLAELKEGLNDLIPGFFTEADPPVFPQPGQNELLLEALIVDENFKNFEGPIPIWRNHDLPALLIEKIKIKKVFPLWAIVLKTQQDLSHSGLPSFENENFKISWLSLETISWDFLFIQDLKKD